MIELLLQLIAILAVMAGTAFSVLGVLGFIGMPDVYTRLHAASKAGPLGAGMILLGVAFAAGDWSVSARAVLGFLFLIATSPLSAHLLARAALKSGVRPDSRTSVNEYDANQ